MAPPVKALLYLRVSDKEQVLGYSLDAQKRAGLQEIEHRGWALAGVFADEGKSARYDHLKRRPAFAAALAAIEAGQAQVMVVHKLDRFARNLKLTLECLDRVAKAGAALVSISEQIDYTTPNGRLFLHMLASLAQWYSENLAGEIKKGQKERVIQGLHASRPPFGCALGEGGIAVPDPATYPGLRLAFEAARDGATDREVASLLNARGYRSRSHWGVNPFTRHTVRKILRNRFYLGETLYAGTWYKGQHAPLIEETLFLAAAAQREANRVNTALCTKTAAHVYSLTGLLWCAHCLEAGDPRYGRINISSHGRGKGPSVNCYAKDNGPRPCPQPRRQLHLIEAELEAWLARLVLPEHEVAAALAALPAPKGPEEGQGERQELEARLGRLKELYSWGDLTREQYLGERAAVQARLLALRPAPARGDLEEVATFARHLYPDLWRLATQPERNRLLRQLIERVTLREGHVETVTPTAGARSLLELRP